MSKKLFYFFTLICCFSLFTACSDDDEKQVDKSWQELVGEYSGENLVLSYGEMALTGKTVTFSATGRLRIVNFQEQQQLLMQM